MRRLKYIFSFVLFFQCAIFEPDFTPGSLRIVLVNEKNDRSIQKASESFSSVRCVVKKGSETKYDKNLTNQGGSFHGEIAGLEPGSDYSVLLYGLNASSDIITRGYKAGISVTAGKTETVTISWGTFLTTLTSPVNNSTINDNTPTFDWSDAGGTAKYDLAVMNSDGSEVIRESTLTVSSHTPSSGLVDGTYTWKVRCQDEQGNWGGWSGVWSFTIPTVVLAPVISTSPSLDFGTVTIGNSSNQTILITNTGTTTLSVLGVTSTDTQFTIVGDAAYSIPAGSYRHLTVKFTPVSAGNQSGTLHIANNSSVNPKDVSLSGMGIDSVASPIFNPSPSVVYYSAQNVTISCTTSGAVIHYTTNGNDPTESDPTFSDGASITMSITKTLKARAYKKGWYPSRITSGKYNIAETGIITDIDGNFYHAIAIGTQIWMLENLKVTHYRNGDPIEYYDDGSDSEKVSTYGHVYGWYSVVDIRNITPVGWHAPTMEEWDVLIDCLGGESVAGGKMKEAGTIHWWSPNTGATNESGFTAISFGGMSASFWTSSGEGGSQDSDYGEFRNLVYNNLDVNSGHTDKGSYYSVRLVRD